MPEGSALMSMRTRSPGRHWSRSCWPAVAALECGLRVAEVVGVDGEDAAVAEVLDLHVLVEQVDGGLVAGLDQPELAVGQQCVKAGFAFAAEVRGHPGPDRVGDPVAFEHQPEVADVDPVLVVEELG